MRFFPSKCHIATLCISTTLFLIGLVFLAVFPQLYDYIITTALKIAPGTKAYTAWQKSPTPIGMSIYFFNWTNHEDFFKNGVKPRFREVGPYSFKQIKEKVNLTWHPENGTASFVYRKTFFFDPENTVGSLDDNIVSIDMIALTATHVARDWNFLPRQPLNLALFASKYFTNKPVRELMFEGYEDSVLQTKNMFSFFSDGSSDRFGWFYGRNNTIGSDGSYNVGVTSDKHYGTLKEWNHSPHTHFYDSQCDGVYGSGGELYSRHQTPDRIYVFSPEMCRTGTLSFEANVTVKGVPSYKYSAGDEILDNGTKIAGNECYCNGQCMPSGVMNTSSCRENAPLFLSLPHFYQADSSYQDAVEGLSPDKNLHELHVTIEPNTGVITDIAARIQLNLLVQPNPSFSIFDNAPKVMFPVFWFEQRMLMSDELASGLSLLLSMPKIARFACIFLMVVGALGVTATLLHVAVCRRRSTNRGNLQPISQQHKITMMEEIPLKTKS